MPFRNLYFLAYERISRQLSGVSQSSMKTKARVHAEQMARAAFPETQLQFNWPELEEGDPGLCANISFSPQLMAFLQRGRRMNRRVIDQLVIAYAASGFGPEVAFREAYLDYMSISGLPPVNKRDITLYGAFFWDFPSLLGLGPGKDWLQHHMPGGEEEAIISGDLTLDDVRARVGAVRGLNYEERLKGLAYRSSRVIERCVDEMISIDPTFFVMGPRNQQGGGFLSNANLRNLASMLSCLVPIIKSYDDIRGDGDTEIDLVDHLKLRVAEIREENEPYKEEYGDWRQLDQGLTIEDLQAETQLALEAQNMEMNGAVKALPTKANDDA